MSVSWEHSKSRTYIAYIRDCREVVLNDVTEGADALIKESQSEMIMRTASFGNNNNSNNNNRAIIKKKQKRKRRHFTKC